MLSHMSGTRFFFAFVALAACITGLSSDPLPQVTIVLVGDSTVTDGAGWGLGFKQFLTGPVTLVNTSRGGRSSQSFMTEGSWTKALALKGSYYLIQFGHNNEPGKPGRSTDMATFVANIRQYVDDARAIGAKPILVTPLTRRQWDKDNPGEIKSSLAPYSEEVRKIGREKNVPVVDLQARSIELCESLGPDKCLEFSPLKTDNGKTVHDGTHLNDKGRVLFARLVVKELRKNVPELAPYLRTEPKEYDPIATDDKFDAVVSADGSGTQTSVQAAIAAAPDHATSTYTILIKPGTYTGQIIVPASKSHLRFVGENADETLLTFSRNVKELDPVDDPHFKGTGVIVLGDDFRADNITFQNTSGDHGQALALRVDGDRAQFRNCRLLCWQDTLMVNVGRDLFEHCYIEGRVDFIYGSATAVFEKCEIHSKNGGHVTAASTPQEHAFGFVFVECHLTGDPTPWSGPGAAPVSPKVPMADLGRPWRPFASVTYIHCVMDAHIKPEGWNNWGKPENEKTARYSEFESAGPGADADARFKWSHQLTVNEAKAYTVADVLKGTDNWSPTL